MFSGLKIPGKYANDEIEFVWKIHLLLYLCYKVINYYELKCDFGTMQMVYRMLRKPLVSGLKIAAIGNKYLSAMYLKKISKLCNILENKKNTMRLHDT